MISIAFIIWIALLIALAVVIFYVGFINYISFVMVPAREWNLIITFVVLVAVFITLLYNPGWVKIGLQMLSHLLPPNPIEATK